MNVIVEIENGSENHPNFKLFMESCEDFKDEVMVRIESDFGHKQVRVKIKDLKLALYKIELV